MLGNLFSLNDFFLPVDLYCAIFIGPRLGSVLYKVCLKFFTFAVNSIFFSLVSFSISLLCYIYWP